MLTYLECSSDCIRSSVATASEILAVGSSDLSAIRTSTLISWWWIFVHPALTTHDFRDGTRVCKLAALLKCLFFSKIMHFRASNCLNIELPKRSIFLLCYYLNFRGSSSTLLLKPLGGINIFSVNLWINCHYYPYQLRCYIPRILMLKVRPHKNSSPRKCIAIKFVVKSASQRAV